MPSRLLVVRMLALAMLFLISAGDDKVVSSSRTDLLSAAGKIRPLEARLKGFEYKKSTSSVSARHQINIRKYAQKIRQEFARRKSSDLLATLGILSFLDGNLDAAIEQLEQASMSDKRRNTNLSDLAAIYLARFQAQGRFPDLIKALSRIDRAIASGDRSDEALFNRALILDKVSLNLQAIEAWKQCLSTETNEGWRREIYEHLRHIDVPSSDSVWERQKIMLARAAQNQDIGTVQRIVSKFPQQAREFLERDLIVTQFSSQKSADSSLLLSAGEVLASRGEHMSKDFSVLTESLLINPIGYKKIDALRRGLNLYSAGMSAYDKGLYRQSDQDFRAAAIDLRKAGSTFEGWAVLQRARCHYQSFDYTNVGIIIHALLKRFPSDRYPALSGKALWILGLSSLIEGRSFDAVKELTESLVFFKRLGEDSNVAAVGSILARAYEEIGDPISAWNYRYEALCHVRRQGRLDARHLTLEEVAVASLKISEPRSAMYFQEELLRLASISGNAVNIAGALRDRAWIDLLVQDYQGALASLSKADDMITKIPNAMTRRSLEGDLLALRGEAKLSVDARDAGQDLDKAFKLLKGTGDNLSVNSLALSLNRAHARRLLGQFDLAENILQGAIDDMERQRLSLPSDPLRSAFFDASRSIFDEMIFIQATKGDDRRSFGYAERAKGRALLDALQRLPSSNLGNKVAKLQNSGPLRAEDIGRQLPSNTALIQYWIGPHQLYIWVVLGQNVRLTCLNLESDELAESSALLVQAIRRRDREEFSFAARRLFDFLISPVRSQLSGATAIVFVPDKFLYAVPFSALMDSQSGTYVVQNYLVSIAPSATAYLECRKESLAKRRQISKPILLIGSPNIDQSYFIGLPYLRAAGEEVEAIGRLYSDADLWQGRSATKRRFLEDAGNYSIIHFAGHSVLNLDSPMLSMLVFAAERVGEKRDPGALFAYQIVGRKFLKTQLIVLAACGTARGYTDSTEGVASIARPFLASRVPSVIASLWNIDDKPSVEFFTQFYKCLRVLHDPVAALRATQVKLLNGSNYADPLFWAGYEDIGAGSITLKEA